MKLLFIIDPIEKLLSNDTSVALMKEAKRRGHKVSHCYVEDLRMAHHIAFHGSIPLENYQIILMRKNPPFTLDYFMAVSILGFVNPKKTFVVNHPNALRTFTEKMGILQFQRFIPDTLVSKKYSDFVSFLRKHKKIVLKPLESFGGYGVFVLQAKDKNRNAILELLTQHQTRFIMAQKYLTKVKHGDKRVLVLNGEVLGAENRIGHPEDHRSNISTGGLSHKTSLSARERRMCEIVSKRLAEQGIYFAGLDLIGGYITEINITSPTGLIEINRHDRLHLEKLIVDFLEEAAKKTL